jgi:hypothetical protein
MRRHPIRDFPPPLVEFYRLRSFNTAHQTITLLLARRTERLDFPALVGVRDDFAVCGAVAVGLDGGVAAFDEGFGGEDGVAAGCVDVEAVAAHF